MSVLWRHQVILGLVAGLVFFTNLGSYALFDEDEPKNAVCGFEMYERGDWIVPTFNAQLRTDKPILIYWWMQLSFRLFGVSEFSARLGSALLAVGTVFLTYHMGRKLYSPPIAFLAALILATSLLFSVLGRAVTPDATLISCLMLVFSSYIWAVAARRGGHFCGVDSAPQQIELVPQSMWTAVPMFVAMGLAILAKGPIGVLLPCTIIGLFLLINRRNQDLAVGQLSSPTGSWWQRYAQVVLQVFRPRQFFQTVLAMRLIRGVLIVMAVALPWYVLVGLKTDGAWLKGFLGDHNLGRFLEPKENHSGPIFYYAVVLLMGCFPWSVFLPLAVWQLRSRLIKGAAWSDSDRLLACWTGVWFVFFSLARTKLPNYVLPMYPALALVTARFLHEWTLSAVGTGMVSFRHCLRALSMVGVVIIVGIPIASTILFPGEQLLSLIGVVPLAGGAIAYVATLHEQRTRALRVICVTVVTFVVLVVGIAPLRVGQHLDSPKLADAARQISGSDRPTMATIDAYAPSLIFYAKKPVEGLRRPDDVTTFLNEHPDGFVVTRADRMGKLPLRENHLVEVSRCRRFLRRYDVVLLARSQQVATADATSPR
ncbi:MAG TPA: glycosyltransferase family 39 protein [Schlesneria sp.]